MYVGINKSLKDILKESASTWRREQYALSPPGEKLPTPKRQDILVWLKEIWDEFPVSIVRNSFTEVDTSMKMESTTVWIQNLILIRK